MADNDRSCQLLVPFTPEQYMQSLMVNEERLFVGVSNSAFGTARRPECGHYTGFVQVNQERRLLKPCFFTEEAAADFISRCGEAFQDLMAQRGRNTSRIHNN